MYNETSENTRTKRRFSVKQIVGILLASVIIGSAAGAGGAYAYGERTAPRHQTVIGKIAADGTEASKAAYSSSALSASDIYKTACRQTVGISSAFTTTNVFGQTVHGATSGTGFIISDDGYILTNRHVIEHARKSGSGIKVMTWDGDEYEASVIGSYADNDIAVLKIDAHGLDEVTFADSDAIQVGDGVFCVGNPLGELTFTMTGGMISALDRMISTDAYTSIGMFQIDAAVNSGNSGGPVYNGRGEVIGVVTAKYSEAGVEGLGFAIPINDAASIAAELISNGYVSGEASLGISVRNVEPYVSEFYRIPPGVYVYSVSERSGAEYGGIDPGDVITAVDGSAVGSVDELKAKLRGYGVGDSAVFTVYRNGSYLDLQVTLDEKQPDGPAEDHSLSDGIKTK